MHRDVWKLVLSLSIAVFAFISIADGSEAVKGAKKDIEVFKKDMSAKLVSLEKQIADLKAQGGTAKTKTVQELEEARDNVKSQLTRLSENSKEGWQTLKKNLAESMASLNSKVQSALKE